MIKGIGKFELLTGCCVQRFVVPDTRLEMLLPIIEVWVAVVAVTARACYVLEAVSHYVKPTVLTTTQRQVT